MKLASLLKAVDTFYKFAQTVESDEGFVAETVTTIMQQPMSDYLFKKVIPDQAPKYPCELEFTVTINIANDKSISIPKLVASLSKAESFVPEVGKQADPTLKDWVNKTGVYQYVSSNLVRTVGAALAQKEAEIKAQIKFPYTGTGKVVISIDWG